MDRKSIAKILRDFGKDYAAAADWVADDIIAAYQTPLLVKLTAAQEQLAEMREASRALKDFCDEHDIVGKISSSSLGIALSEELDELLWKISDALSAAPKRGRVLWEGRPVVRDGHLWLDDDLWQEIKRIVEEQPEGGTVTVRIGRLNDGRY